MGSENAQLRLPADEARLPRRGLRVQYWVTSSEAPTSAVQPASQLNASTLARQQFSSSRLPLAGVAVKRATVAMILAAVAIVAPPSSQATCIRSDDPWGSPDLVVAFKVINTPQPVVVHRDEPCRFDVWTSHQAEILDTFEGSIPPGSWITINTEGGGPVWDECEGVYVDVKVTPSAPLDHPGPWIGFLYEQDNGYWFKACLLDRYAVECNADGSEGVRLPRRAAVQYGSGIVDRDSSSDESETVWVSLEQFRRITDRKTR